MSLSNNPAEQLADEYGEKVAKKKALEKEIEDIKEQLLNYVQDIPVVGLRWTVTRSDVTSRRLDTELIEAYLGERANEFKKPSTSIQLRVKQTKILGNVAE